MRGNEEEEWNEGEEKIRDKVERLKVGERVDSDHHPLVACVTDNSKRERRERE